MTSQRTARASRARRPRRAYRTDRLTNGAHAVTWAVVAVGLLVLAVRYPSMPETIPVHFDISGTPDSFGPRSALLPLVGTWLVLQVGISLLSRHPQVFNYPVDVTEANAQQVYREGERMVVAVGLCLATTFLGIVLAVLDANGPGIVVVAVGIVGLLIACFAGLVRSSHAGVSSGSR